MIKFNPDLEEYCPICSENGERNLKVCDKCKRVLMPDYGEDDYSFEHLSIADYSGLININQY